MSDAELLMSSADEESAWSEYAEFQVKTFNLEKTGFLREILRERERERELGF